jgi:hypothetical protein
VSSFGKRTYSTEQLDRTPPTLKFICNIGDGKRGLQARARGLKIVNSSTSNTHEKRS